MRRALTVGGLVVITATVVAALWLSVDVTGTLAPKFAIDVKSEVTGTVTAVHVTEWVAVKKGDRYVLSGRKLWITNAAESSLFIVFANVDPSLGYKGITAFMVSGDAEGAVVDRRFVERAVEVARVVGDAEVEAEGRVQVHGRVHDGKAAGRPGGDQAQGQTRARAGLRHSRFI